jgi:tryptophanyl-tRNA synthetase
MTPWTVSGPVDYLAQITHFGTNPIDGELLKRWEHVTRTTAHTWLRRGIIFSHQDLNKILDCVEKSIPIYIYTGRGPSSESMHLGHMIPFKFAKYLQDALNCIIIIQISDDEKFIFKDGSKSKDLKKYNDLCYKNAKDIIACGFDKNKTYMFSNLESNCGDLYFNNILISKATNMNTIKATYGIGETVDEPVLSLVKEALDKEIKSENPNLENIRCFEKLIKNNSNKQSNSVGQCMWPIFQCGPAFATSFRQIFIKAIAHGLQNKDFTQNKNACNNLYKALHELKTIGKTQSIHCLVPMAIDQSPYFRMARDVAHILEHPKPSVIHSEFIPSLQQANSKMNSSSNNNATIFLDMNQKSISNVIKKYAFSGGQTTLEEHRKFGGNVSIDTCYQYLTYFLEDDAELEQIAKKYSSGEMTSSELKDITISIISKIILDHQVIKGCISDDIVMEYFDPNRVLDIGLDNNKNIIDTNLTDYSKYGINFDRTFGNVKPYLK